MKFNLPFKNENNSFVGFTPFLTTVLLLLIHFSTGALDWPEKGDIRAQRDFNSAIGMSVITGYFWFAMRLMHQNVANTLTYVLLKTNQLNEFGAHRKNLALQFNRQIFNAMIISIIITITYCVSEGLISTQQEVHVLLLTATAVPFWFIAFLFIFQIYSTTAYLTNKVLTKTDFGYDRLRSIVTILRHSISNSIFAMGALAIFPVFWLKKEIPSLDVLGVTFFTGFISLYLFFPVIKLNKKLKEEKCKTLEDIESEIKSYIRRYAKNDKQVTGGSIEALESEREEILKLNYTLSSKDKVRVAACVAIIPVSWLVLFVTEWMIELINR